MLPTSLPARRLRCARCGYSMELSADELLRFSRGDWPRCCILAMILEVEGSSVGLTDKTDLERASRCARKMFPD